MDLKFIFLIPSLLFFFNSCISSPETKSFDENNSTTNSHSVLEREMNYGRGSWPNRVISVDGRNLNIEEWHDVELLPGSHTLLVEFFYFPSDANKILVYKAYIPIDINDIGTYVLGSKVEIKTSFYKVGSYAVRRKKDHKINYYIRDKTTSFIYWHREISRFDFKIAFENGSGEVVIDKDYQPKDHTYYLSFDRWRKYQILKSYSTNKTTIDDFYKEGWNAYDPLINKVGIIKDEIYGKNNKLYMGYYLEKKTPFFKDGTKLDINQFERIDILKYSSEIFKNNEKDKVPILLCILKFTNGILTNLSIIEGEDRFITSMDNCAVSKSCTVLDKVTGLVWASSDSGYERKYRDAQEYCRNFNGNGFSDWRMPTIDELSTIYDKNLKNVNGYHTSNQIKIQRSSIWAYEKNGTNPPSLNFRTGKITNSSSLFVNGALPVRSY